MKYRFITENNNTTKIISKAHVAVIMPGMDLSVSYENHVIPPATHFIDKRTR